MTVAELDVGDVVHLKRTIDHSNCHRGTCRPMVVCPNCSANTMVRATRGRWDEERQVTARPYEPVWVEMGCGCVFGDPDAARPKVSTTPAGGAE